MDQVYGKAPPCLRVYIVLPGSSTEQPVILTSARRQNIKGLVRSISYLVEGCSLDVPIDLHGPSIERRVHWHYTQFGTTLNVLCLSSGLGHDELYS